MDYSVICPTWDYGYEYEPHTTLYTLTVYEPPRPLPSWIPAFLTREKVDYEDNVPQRGFVIKPDPSHYTSGGFGPHDLVAIKTKQIRIQSQYFPAEMRCQHLQGKTKKCNKGCYFLEKPIKKCRFKCKRVDCEGHVFEGWKMGDRNGVECFGEKGKRLVTVMSYAAYTVAYRLPPA